MIKRHISDELNNAVKNFPVVILTGPRQVGKSTLLYSEFVSKGYNYVSLDDVANRNMAIASPRTFLDSYPCPLIIDEAQKAPELFDEIERIVNETRLTKGNQASAGLFILTGSTRHLLLEKAEESLAGRCVIMNMYPLSISELFGTENKVFLPDLPTINKRVLQTDCKLDRVFKYIVRGFMPFLYDQTSANVSLFYSSYVNTYIEKDLKDVLHVSDEVKFMDFLTLLASNTSQELIYDTYSKDIGVDSKTIKAWISAMVKTGIVYLVHPYNESSIAKRLVKRPKLYFFDTGLVCHLLGVDNEETLKKSFLKGRLFENAVMNEIKKSFLNNGVNQELYFYRDSNNNEVDLVYIRDASINLVEIKSGTSFNLGDVSGFKCLASSKWNKGHKLIVCTIDKVSAISEDVFLIPVSGI